MARIRSIKPEFFTSETIASLDPHARLTFIGLWTHADDTGRALDNPRLIKAAVWPLDDEIGVKAISAHLDAFEGTGLICRYEIDGKRYLHITHWDEHQRIKNPSEPRFPECTRSSHGGLPPEGSRVTPDLPQGFPASRAGAEQGTGNREQGGGAYAPVAQARPDDDTTTALRLVTPPTGPALSPLQTQVRQVFKRWQLGTGKHRAQLDGKRRRKIEQAIGRYPLEDVMDAVDGWVNDPWPDRVHHNDITVLLRDAEHLEKFRDLCRDGPALVPPEMSKARQQLYDEAAVMDAWAAEGVTDDQGRVEGRSHQAQRELSPPADSA